MKIWSYSQSSLAKYKQQRCTICPKGRFRFPGACVGYWFSLTCAIRQSNAYAYGIKYLYARGSWAIQPVSSRHTTLIWFESALHNAGHASTRKHRHVKRWRLLSPRFIIPKIHPKYATEMKKTPDTNRINCIHVC